MNVIILYHVLCGIEISIFSLRKRAQLDGAWNLGAEKKFLVKEEIDSIADPVIASNMGTESAVEMPKPSDCGRFMTWSVYYFSVKTKANSPQRVHCLRLTSQYL
jgi:hypothetical protein